MSTNCACPEPNLDALASGLSSIANDDEVSTTVDGNFENLNRIDDTGLWDTYNDWVFWRVEPAQIDLQARSENSGKGKGLLKLKKSPRKAPTVNVTKPKTAGAPARLEGPRGPEEGPRSGSAPNSSNGTGTSAGAAATVTTDSWRQVAKLTSGIVVRTPSKESSSGESVFADPVPTVDEGAMESQVEVTSVKSTPPPSPEECRQVTKEIGTTKFTIVRHRKAELAPSRIGGDLSLTDLLT
ncbi:unnamed protein product, partial [Nesidiocoris tenuis]